jgi:hypothetical protein
MPAHRRARAPGRRIYSPDLGRIAKGLNHVGTTLEAIETYTPVCPRRGYRGTRNW